MIAFESIVFGRLQVVLSKGNLKAIQAISLCTISGTEPMMIALLTQLSTKRNEQVRVVRMLWFDYRAHREFRICVVTFYKWNEEK